MVSGDDALLCTVMDNLLGNAWKFTKPRPVAEIEFGRTEQSGDPVFFVRDNGVGFNMKYAEKLFGAFQRLHRVEDFPGNGIGLATVRRVVHRHGGRVWATPRPGWALPSSSRWDNRKFHEWDPAHPDCGGLRSGPGPHRSRTSPGGYSLQFERVQTEEDMSAALRLQTWDLVLSDHSLPQFSASSALEVLQESGLDIPFVIVSGKIGEERAVDLMKAGANDYVSKLNLARLIPVVERELRDSASRRERRRVEAELAHLNAERERMLNQRSTLLDINNAVIATLDRPSLFQAIFAAVRRTLPCSGLLLTLRDTEKSGLQTVALSETEVLEEPGAALDSGFAGNSLHHGPSEWVFQNRTLLVRSDLTAGLEFAGEEYMFARGTRSYVSAPLATKGEPFGVLTLASETPGRPERRGRRFLRTRLRPGLPGAR
ncbi:MAG: ATP-binding protein [Ignavibacteriota bacterium]